MKLHDAFTLSAELPQLWAAFHDVTELAEAIPGVEQVTMKDPEHFTARMTVRTAFITLTSNVQGSIHLDEQNHQVEVSLTGQPLAFAGAFRARLSAELAALSETESQVTYDMEIQMAGRLASLGDAIIRSTVAKLAKGFASNLQQKFQKG